MTTYTSERTYKRKIDITSSSAEAHQRAYFTLKDRFVGKITNKKAKEDLESIRQGATAAEVKQSVQVLLDFMILIDSLKQDTRTLFFHQSMLSNDLMGSVSNAIALDDYPKWEIEFTYKRYTFPNNAYIEFPILWNITGKYTPSGQKILPN